MLRYWLQLGASLSVLFVGASACAAVPVEESNSSARNDTRVSTAAATASANSNARLSELFYQLQVMQDEIRALRGTVEEQGHVISRLRKDQKEQYLDLDQRVLKLSSSSGGARTSGPRNSVPARNASGAPAAGAGNAGTSDTSGAPRPVLRDGEVYVTTNASNASTGPSGSNTAAPAAASGEQSAYSAAFEQLKARDFDRSIRSFNKLIVDYPGGQYTGHAFYWLGELYLAKNNEEKARAQFAQVIDLYPGHAKRGDALYKIGVVLHRLGDNHKALEYLNRVRAEHPNTKSAQLAADYAKEMQ